MRLTTIALAGIFLLTANSAYAADPMANTYANTITSVDAKSGDLATLLFNADGTYSASGTAAGKPIQYKGQWALKDNGNTICLTPQVPPNTPNPPPTSCSSLVAHAVGDKWSITDDHNTTFNVSLAAGR